MDEQNIGVKGADGIFKSVSAQRAKWVSAAHSPLAFCALALLIVEAFIWGCGAAFGLSDTVKIIALAVGVLLFMGVFATVIFLVIKFPHNLVFSEESHVRVEEMRVLGSKDVPRLQASDSTKTTEAGEENPRQLEAPRPDSDPSNGESDNA
ncbi:hypothetical protein BCAR13_110068 [Paraburkholderia caribensis]|uniref:hypothetical protein n=1 Tax=Paraburkholderia caribensis TaxID=75105 RepID=UPI001CADE0D1|nr:hypothetical protein [Paraburkholderia caribensis]CAG9193949.1 hypothetical protein BCAR13_110068 [Paraburkholderia caribensis]